MARFTALRRLLEPDGADLPWERRRRRTIERTGFVLAVGGAVVILAIVLVVLNMSASVGPP